MAKWKQKITKELGYESLEEAPADEDAEGDQSADKKDYDYLLGMPIWNLTMEKKDEILKQQKAKTQELNALKAKTANELWIDDLNQFLAELDKFEVKEKEEEAAGQLKAYKAGKAMEKPGARKNFTTGSKPGKLEYMPAADSELIEPTIDASLKSSHTAVKKEIKTENNIVDIIVSNDNNLTDEQITAIIQSKGKAKKAAPAEKEKKDKKVKDEKVEKENQSGESDEEQVVSKKPDDKSKAKTASNTLTNYFKKEKVESGSESDEEVEPLSKRIVSRAKKPVKYDVDVVEDEDDDDEPKRKPTKKKDDSDFEIVESDDDFSMKAKSSKTKPKSEEVDKVKKEEVEKFNSLFKPKGNKEEAKKAKPADDAKKTKAKAAEKDKPSGKSKENVAPKDTKETKVTKSKPTAKKAKYEESDEDSFVVSEEENSEEEETTKKNKGKRQLMAKDDKKSPFDLFKKVSRTATTKKPKNVIESDDELYAID